MRVRTGETQWKIVATRLAERVAALQGYGEAGSEVVARCYDTEARFYEGRMDEHLLEGKSWSPANGGSLYYGELTAAHVDNILALAEEVLEKERTLGRGLFGWNATSQQKWNRWSQVKNDMTRLKILRLQRGPV